MVKGHNKANGNKGAAMAFNSHLNGYEDLPVLVYEVDEWDGVVYETFIHVHYTVTRGTLVIVTHQTTLGDGTLSDPYDADGNPVYGWVGGRFYPRVHDEAPTMMVGVPGEADDTLPDSPWWDHPAAAG